MKPNKSFFTVLLFFVAYGLGAQNVVGSKIEAEKIGEKARAFSAAIVEGNAIKIAEIYTEDGKIFPNNMDILEGKDALIKYWTPRAGAKTTYHKILPEEIRVFENEAYDYGYYEGVTSYDDGKTVSWKGKYVTTWIKVDGEWKLYLDIWNRIQD